MYVRMDGWMDIYMYVCIFLFVCFCFVFVFLNEYNILKSIVAVKNRSSIGSSYSKNFKSFPNTAILFAVCTVRVT